MKNYYNEKLSKNLAGYFKKAEIFSQMRIPSQNFLIIRCDGRNFSSLVEKLNLSKLDSRFHEILVKTAKDTMEKSGLDIRVAYVASDEISFLFKQIPFSRRIEKLDSIVASFVSSAFTLYLCDEFKFREPISFDARLVVLKTINDVVWYFIWCQKETWRNCINALAQWILLTEGNSPEVIYHKLYGKKTPALINFLREKGIKIENVENWKKYGTLLVRRIFIKEEYDPQTKQPVKAVRFKIEQFSELFDFDKLLRLVQESFLSKIDARKIYTNKCLMKSRFQF